MSEREREGGGGGGIMVIFMNRLEWEREAFGINLSMLVLEQMDGATEEGSPPHTHTQKEREREMDER